MTRDPNRMLSDPVYGAAFQEWAEQEGIPTPLSNHTMREVKALVAASTMVGAGAALADSVAGTASVTEASGIGVGASKAAATGSWIGGLSIGSTAAKTTAIAIFAALGTGALMGGGYQLFRTWFAQPDAEDVSTRSLDDAADDSVPHEEVHQEQASSLPPSERVTGDAVTGGANAPAQSRARTLPPSGAAPQSTPAKVAAEGASKQRSTLAEEVALLREIKSLLDSDPAAAEKPLALYLTRYPDGALRSEYDALVARARALRESNP